MKLTSAVLGFSAFLVAPTLAADLGSIESRAGFFGAIEGRYLLEPEENTRDNDAPGFSEEGALGDGLGLAGRLGYRFESPWDIAVGVSYSDYSKGEFQPGGGTWQVMDGDLLTVDGEVGYELSSDADHSLRIHVGVRYVDFDVEAVDGSNGYNFTGESWNIGPRIGFDGMFGVSEQLSIVGAADASILFGERDNQTTGVFAFQNDRSETVWQVGGRLGVDWEIASDWHLTAGYRANYWGDIQAKYGLGANGGVPVEAGRGSVSLIDHGPFLSLGFNL